MEEYKYTGPATYLSPSEGGYGMILLVNEDEVKAEVNINIATIKGVYDKYTKEYDKVKEFYVAAKYLEPVKPEPIHFDPKDDELEHESFNTEDFFDGLNESIKKFPFYSDDSLSQGWDNICQRAWGKKYGDTYYTPKKVMDAINDDFDVILSEMSDTHKAKNHDYGDSFTELYDECGSTYAYAHLKEKLNRIKTLRKSRQRVKKESMEDSLLDLASYAIMWVCELRKEKKNEEE